MKPTTNTMSLEISPKLLKKVETLTLRIGVFDSLHTIRLHNCCNRITPKRAGYVTVLRRMELHPTAATAPPDMMAMATFFQRPTHEASPPVMHTMHSID